MPFEISKGTINKALRVVLYGTEGIGKSTFASRFPGAVFIDTEGSTNQLREIEKQTLIFLFLPFHIERRVAPC